MNLYQLPAHGSVEEQFLDACNLWRPPDEFVKQRETLKRHCDEVGRDEATIRRGSFMHGFRRE
jgi:hypothetical protein